MQIQKKLLFIFSLLIVSACGQNYNSSFNDQGTYGDIGITPGTNLYNAYKVLQNKCFQCHSASWKDYKTSQDFIDHGLIISGNPASSTIYNQLRNVGGTMPPSQYSELTTEELETLRTWIISP